MKSCDERLGTRAPPEAKARYAVAQNSATWDLDGVSRSTQENEGTRIGVGFG